MKKKLLIIGLIFAVIFAGLAVYAVESGLWANRALFLMPRYRTYVSNFDQYSKDFQVLADFALKESKEHNYPKDAFIGVDRSDGLKLAYSENLEFIPLSDQVQKSLERVNQSFSDAGGEFDTIRFSKNEVLFYINNDYYVVVYALDGFKPGVPPEDRDANLTYQIKRLKGNWWSITGN
ncbi:MAG: hypothetical protein FWD65_06310 [Coriobacteriia bacterium]|nr:hypothetical protein [Coriobacteriia bacterium]